MADESGNIIIRLMIMLLYLDVLVCSKFIVSSTVTTTTNAAPQAAVTDQTRNNSTKEQSNVDQMPQEQRLALQIIIADPPPPRQSESRRQKQHNHYHYQGQPRNRSSSSVLRKRPYDISDPSNTIERLVYMFDTKPNAGGGKTRYPQLILAKHKRDEKSPQPPKRMILTNPQRNELVRTQHRPPLTWRRGNGSGSSDSSNNFHKHLARFDLNEKKHKLTRLTTMPPITTTTEFFKLISSAHSPIKLIKGQASEKATGASRRNGSIALDAADYNSVDDSGLTLTNTTRVRVASSTDSSGSKGEQMRATSTASYPTFATEYYDTRIVTTAVAADSDSTADSKTSGQQRVGTLDGRVMSPAIMVRDGDSDELDSRRDGISLVRAGSSNSANGHSYSYEYGNNRAGNSNDIVGNEAIGAGGGTVSFDDNENDLHLSSGALQAEEGRRGMFNLTLNLQHGPYNNNNNHHHHHHRHHQLSNQYQHQQQQHHRHHHQQHNIAAEATNFFSSQGKKPVAIIHQVGRQPSHLPPMLSPPQTTTRPLMIIPDRIKVEEFPGQQDIGNKQMQQLIITNLLPATTSAPQLIRLISKQRHKFDENVISPTLTVVDNAAIRLPPNATSVHNNKLIVAIRPGRPHRRHPPTTQFPVYNIVAGITPPYASRPSQAQYTRPPSIDGSVYGLLKPTQNPTSSANSHGSTQAPSSFGAQNIKFPAPAPSVFQPEHAELPEKFNVTIPDSANIVGPNKVPDKILVETGEEQRPPADAVVLSDSAIISRPHGSQTVTNHDNLIIRLSTTRRPTRVSTTKRINIVSANTTVVTTNADQLHDVLSNVIAGSHQQDHIHHLNQNRPNSDRPGIFAYLGNLLNAGFATTAITILTVVKTIFFAIMVMFLPPIALTAALMQALNFG